MMRWRSGARARRRARPGDGADRVATTVHRLAVLLAAGVAPAAAWRHLAEAGPADRGDARIGDGVAGPPVVSVAADAAARGADVAGAIVAHVGAVGDPGALGWRAVAAGWTVAERAGSPIAGMLRDTAGTLRDLAALQRDLDATLAGPRATARLVALLPPAGVGLGMVLGFDPLGVLIGSPLGVAAGATGAGLLLAARAWSRALADRAARPDPAPGLAMDLLAIALAGGASVARARASVDAALRACLPEVHAGPEADDAVELSRRAGVPVAELLRAEAGQARLAARAAGQARAAALAVQLMAPLALCTLPAFVLLGVVPMLASVVASTLADLS
ncbi:type II secretion system F family protein [Agromyces sp. SYSU T00194]|uniref:type II secretion system F family protein n=1 Tax=Agromyces chitinivorans TaxID=3158560 RepID=UPI0033961410